MAKIFLFDIDNTVLYHTTVDYYKIVSRESGAPISEIFDYAEPLLDPLDSGKISIREFETRLARRFMVDRGKIDYKKFYMNEMRPIPGMINLVNALHKNYTTACLSNVDPVRYKNTKRLLANAKFDHKFASFMFGVVKPNLKIFLAILERMHANPDDIVFIDDKSGNVAAARSLGMRAIRFRSHRDLKKRLSRFLKNTGYK